MMLKTCFKQVVTGATNDWESCEMLQKHLFGTFHRYTGLLVTGDGIIIRYERGILKGSVIHEQGWGGSSLR